MTPTFDNEAYERAKKQADERYPLPKDTPVSGAIRYAMVTVLVVASMEILLPHVGLWWAGFVTICLGGLIGWLDANGASKANAREFHELYEIYRQRNK